MYHQDLETWDTLGKTDRRRASIENDGLALNSDPPHQDSTLARTNLVVELPKKAETEQTIDTDPFRQIVGVHAEVTYFVTKASELRDAKQVAGFAADRGTDHGDSLSMARIVSGFIECLRSDERVFRPGVESESKSCSCSRPLETSQDEDQPRR